MINLIKNTSICTIFLLGAGLAYKASPQIQKITTSIFKKTTPLESPTPSVITQKGNSKTNLLESNKVLQAAPKSKVLTDFESEKSWHSVYGYAYTEKTELKVQSFIQKILSFLAAPFVFFYDVLHSLAGKVAFLPSSRQFMKDLDKRRQNINLEEDWKYKRIAIDIDGLKIDAVIFGKNNTIHNKKWVLYSDGQKGYYEGELSKGYELKQILTELNANGIVFNYPGVGKSSGMPNREMMAKAYRAVLTFLEDPKKGIGADKIVLYGYSMGGGVQGDALTKHSLKKEIRYVLVKKQTFSTLSKAAGRLFKGIPLGLGSLVKGLGWNLGSLESSKATTAPEIIIQTAKLEGNETYKEIKDSKDLIDDGIIAAEATLGKALLDQNITQNKVFFGVKETHYEKLKNTKFLTYKINQLLQ